MEIQYITVKIHSKIRSLIITVYLGIYYRAILKVTKGNRNRMGDVQS